MPAPVTLSAEYEAKLRALILKYSSNLKGIYFKSITDVSLYAKAINQFNPDASPALKKKMEQVVQQLAAGVEINLTTSIQQAWELADIKNNELEGTMGTRIYHGTTEDAAKQIAKSGFDINKTMDGSIWFTSDKTKIIGGEVSAAGKGAIIERGIDESTLKLGGYDEQDKYSTDELINMGYDGLKLVDKDQITYQIFHPEKLLDKVIPIKKSKTKGAFTNTADALVQFQNRVDNGMNLSDRVWKNIEPYKHELEAGLTATIGAGQGARPAATLLKKNLNEPDKLFRRVRDKNGKLQLSKAARAYHPTTGVYRSSYQNALRLTGTEINMAYRNSDYNRWNKEKFVTGIEVRTSNNHPFLDECDAMAGVYPVDFLFEGWHPKCRCNAIPILVTIAQLEAQEDYFLGLTDTPPDIKYTTKPPDGAIQWIQDNWERMKGWKNPPYWVQHNQVYMKRIMNPDEKWGVLPKPYEEPPFIEPPPVPVPSLPVDVHDLKSINDVSKYLIDNNLSLAVDLSQASLAQAKELAETLVEISTGVPLNSISIGEKSSYNSVDNTITLRNNLTTGDASFATPDVAKYQAQIKDLETQAAKVGLTDEEKFRLGLLQGRVEEAVRASAANGSVRDELLLQYAHKIDSLNAGALLKDGYVYKTASEQRSAEFYNITGRGSIFIDFSKNYISENAASGISSFFAEAYVMKIKGEKIPPRLDALITDIIKKAGADAAALSEQAIPLDEGGFVPAKTVARAKQFAMDLFKNAYGLNMKAGVSGLTVEQMNVQNEQLFKLIKAYNISPLISRTHEITLKYKSGNGYGGRVVHRDGRRVIEINYGDETATAGSRLFNPDAKIVRQFSRVDKVNDIIATLTHEFGHTISVSHSVTMFQTPLKSAYATEELYAQAFADFTKIKTFWDELEVIKADYTKETTALSNAYKANQKVVIDLRNEGKGDEAEKKYLEGEQMQKDLMAIHLGTYAVYNIREFQAETFTEYLLSSAPSKYATLAGKLIDKTFKK